MDEERKNVMISGRLPKTLVERVDYVTRNNDSATTTNRSQAMRAAFENWLPDQEKQIGERLGGSAAKKPRP